MPGAEPWEHVLGFIGGAYVLNQMNEIEAKYELKVAEKLAEKIERNQVARRTPAPRASRTPC